MHLGYMRIDQFIIHPFRIVEAMAGLVAVFGLAYGPLTIAILVLIFSALMGELQTFQFALCFVVPTLPMALWITKMSDRALKQFTWRNDETSFAMCLASELPRLPLIFGGPLGIWWVSHFITGMGIIHYWPVIAAELHLWPGLAEGIPAFVFCALFHFAANVYLVLALEAFGANWLKETLWRFRIVFDIAIALLAWFVVAQ